MKSQGFDDEHDGSLSSDKDEVLPATNENIPAQMVHRRQKALLKSVTD